MIQVRQKQKITGKKNQKKHVCFIQMVETRYFVFYVFYNENPLLLQCKK